MYVGVNETESFGICQEGWVAGGVFQILIRSRVEAEQVYINKMGYYYCMTKQQRSGKHAENIEGLVCHTPSRSPRTFAAAHRCVSF